MKTGIEKLHQLGLGQQSEFSRRDFLEWAGTGATVALVMKFAIQANNALKMEQEFKLEELLDVNLWNSQIEWSDANAEYFLYLREARRVFDVLLTSKVKRVPILESAQKYRYFDKAEDVKMENRKLLQEYAEDPDLFQRLWAELVHVKEGDVLKRTY